MSKLIRIVSLAAALAVMICGCAFAGGEPESSGQGKTDVLTIPDISELTNNLDPMAYLPEDIAKNYVKIPSDRFHLDSGLFYSYESLSDDYPDIDAYMYSNPSASFPEYAMLEAGFCGGTAFPLNDNFTAFGHVAFEEYDDKEYISYSILTEKNNVIYEIVLYHHTKRVPIGSSSKSFAVPLTMAEGTPNADNKEVAVYERTDKDASYNNIKKITIFETEIEEGKSVDDYLADLTEKQGLAIDYATRNGKPFTVLVGYNPDGTFDLGFCFPENGKLYDLCFTGERDAEAQIIAVSHSIL